MAKILVVDDDKDIVEILSLYLQREGYEVVPAYDGVEALRLFHKEKPLLVILDIMLPKMDGWEVCKILRERFDVPILMLTARTEEADRVLGLELGADDYVVKPFSPREVTARVKAILRRKERPPQITTIGKLTLDRTAYEARIGEKKIPLTPKQLELLYLLAENRGRVVKRTEILNKLWKDEDIPPDERAVDQHIKRIRDLIDLEEAGVRLSTIRGVGYKLEEI
ncbi:MAG: response regulator transcription factor [bacterium]